MTDLAEATRIPTNLSVTLSMNEEIRASLRQGEGYVEVAKAYEITSHDDAQAAVDDRNTCLRAIDKLEALRKGFVKPAQDIIENARALFNPAIDGYKQAAALLNDRLGGWQQKEALRIADENAAREAEARRIRQEAEAKAAAERARAEEIAAQKRREAEEAEKRRQEAEAAGNARAAAAAAAAAAKAHEQEQAALENGAAKAMEAQMQAAAVVTAPFVEAPKLAGNTMRENFNARLKPGVTEDQAKALIAAACSRRPELLAMLKVDTSALNKMAKALKGAFNVPGYEAVDTPIQAGNRK